MKCRCDICLEKQETYERAVRHLPDLLVEVTKSVLDEGITTPPSVRISGALKRFLDSVFPI